MTAKRSITFFTIASATRNANRFFFFLLFFKFMESLGVKVAKQLISGIQPECLWLPFKCQ